MKPFYLIKQRILKLIAKDSQVGCFRNPQLLQQHMSLLRVPNEYLTKVLKIYKSTFRECANV